MSDDDFKKLPSWMEQESARPTDETIRAMARAERRGLRVQADREQVFAILWGRHGTGNEHDQHVAWRWFNAWPAINAGISPIARRKPSPTEAADFVTGSYFARLDADQDDTTTARPGS